MDAHPRPDIVQKVCGDEYVITDENGVMTVDPSKWTVDVQSSFISVYFSDENLATQIKSLIKQPDYPIESSSDVLFGLMAPVFHARALENQQVLSDILSSSQANVSLSLSSQ